MCGDALMQAPGQSNVLADHAHIALTTRMLQRQPDFQCAKSPRVLRAHVDEVCCFNAEMVVGRVVRKSGAQVLGIAHQSTPRLEWRVKPLVRIDRDGIGEV
jgi:hypothetical protein